jgi:hypothetical protein
MCTLQVGLQALIGLSTLRSLNLVSYGGRSHHCLDNHSFGCAAPGASSFLAGSTPARSAWLAAQMAALSVEIFLQLHLQSACCMLALHA